MTTAIVRAEIADIQHRGPAVAMRLVSDVATATRTIVEASAMNLGGRKYVRVEGWQAIAAAHGCTVSADLVEVIEGGVRAVASVRRLDDGTELGRAEGFVGTDERSWQSRPMFARRAMAQTRAISRACRSAFAHVVVAMNALGARLETTPAEEMPEEEQRAEHAGPASPASLVSILDEIKAASTVEELAEVGRRVKALHGMSRDQLDDLRAAFVARKHGLSAGASA